MLKTLLDTLPTLSNTMLLPIMAPNNVVLSPTIVSAACPLCYDRKRPTTLSGTFRTYVGRDLSALSFPIDGKVCRTINTHETLLCGYSSPLPSRDNALFWMYPGNKNFTWPDVTMDFCSQRGGCRHGHGAATNSRGGRDPDCIRNAIELPCCSWEIIFRGLSRGQGRSSCMHHSIPGHCG